MGLPKGESIPLAREREPNPIRDFTENDSLTYPIRPELAIMALGEVPTPFL